MLLFQFHTVGDPNLSSIPYRSVPYRFPLEYLSRSRSQSARRTVFSLNSPFFNSYKSVSASRTVVKNWAFCKKRKAYR
jgi:hypothetical protein